MALEGVRGQLHAPAGLYPRERPGTHFTGGWVGPRASLNRYRKSRPTGIWSLDSPAPRQSLYLLSYPATQTTEHSVNIMKLGKWRVQNICTWPSTCAWGKQQMDSDRLCNIGKGSGCLTATEVTIDRHAGKELSIPQPDWHKTFVTAV